MMFSSVSEIIFDASTQDRIEDEILGNARTEAARMKRWVAYLRDQLTFPFQARCIKKLDISPLAENDVVMVEGLDTEAYGQDIFVVLNWHGNTLVVPLSQLEGINIDAKTRQGMEDWYYWHQSGRAVSNYRDEQSSVSCT